MSSKNTALLAVLLLSFAGPGFAGVGVRIAGRVTDADQRPVQGAVVTVTAMVPDVDGSDDSSIRVRLETDKKGRYRGVLLHSSRIYRYLVEKPGFKTIQDFVEVGLDRGELNAPLDRDFLLEAVEPTAADGASPAALFNQGIAAARGKDFPTAASRFEEALARDPELPGARSALAKAYLLSGEAAKAARIADEMLARTPRDAEVLRLRHDAYSALGERAEALKSLHQLAAVERTPATAALLYNEGVLRYNAGDYPAAADLFAEAAKIDPTSLQAELALAEACLRADRLDEALAAAREVLSRDPGNLSAERIRDKVRARRAAP